MNSYENEDMSYLCDLTRAAQAVARERDALLVERGTLRKQKARLIETLEAIAGGNAGNFPACIKLTEHVLRELGEE